MSIDSKGSILKHGRYVISSCYDGQDHIYMYTGYPFSHKIQRFNLTTHTVELYHRVPIKKHIFHILSFFYNGIVYSLDEINSRLMIFSPVSRTFDIYKIKELKRSDNSFKRFHYPITKLACTDNRGNLHLP